MKMIRRLIRSNFLRRILTANTPLHFCTFPKLINRPKFFFLASAGLLKDRNTKSDMADFDLVLKEACEVGESAVVQVLDSLKVKIIEVSKAYKDCLNKQMTIIKEASKSGALSEKWDSLPEYRTLGSGLRQELDSFVVTINTVGQLAHNETLQYITQQKQLFKLIANKHKELEKLIKKQIEEVQKLESKVLSLNRDDILKTK
ncbi:hypothetical protein MTP99_010710 [Tenebrio molitor]|jgi:hypothetical protein|nr:hypothetical protein MTP99_010710 [Tenebrio molitor]